MPPAFDLYNRLKLQKNEISLIDCEKTERNDISKAFRSLGERIKMILLVIQTNGSEDRVTRVADYGADEQDAADKMMLAMMSETESLLDNLNHLRRSAGPAP